jgi:hypothetical protein
MMSDRDFGELEIKATIAPHSVKWPTESLHWKKLHAVVDEARERVSKAHAQMDEIDGGDLSEEEKQHQRCEVAAQALTEFEASKTLNRAREGVRYDGSAHMLKALEQATTGWNRAMDKIAERAGVPAPNWRAAKFRPYPRH